MSNLLTIKNLSFFYNEYDTKYNLPTEGHNGITNISFDIPEGSFVTLCGSTGSGKSTLLKLIKRDIITAGKQSGEIIFDGKNLTDYSSAELASYIGLLFQNPEDQIVTDKVWHEIAFGLENIGTKQEEMESRLAEALAFFRLENLWSKECSCLSGGQKQLVSLAGVLSMYPRLLLLDEPTSMLDPEASEHYISTLKKLQSSLGLTVIIAEHNLERLLPISDMLMIMDKGSLLYCDRTDSVLRAISQNNVLTDKYDFPLPVRFGIKHNAPNIPQDLNSGAALLRQLKENGGISASADNKEGTSVDDTKKRVGTDAIDLTADSSIGTPALTLKNITFRYAPKAPDVVSSLSVTFKKGTIYAVLGCNASGKSTLLNLLAGNYRPQLGSFSPKLTGLKIAYMPQDTDNLFVADTIEKEMKLAGLLPDSYPEYIKKFDTSRGPLDLSGGEKQLLALARISAIKPDILLLDEPTKGTDSISRLKMGEVLGSLKASGTTIIMACHDMDFAAEVADECAIMSMGRLTTFLKCRDFFISNQLYTTPARSMSRGIIDGLYLDRDIMKL